LNAVGPTLDSEVVPRNVERLGIRELEVVDVRRLSFPRDGEAPRHRSCLACNPRPWSESRSRPKVGRMTGAARVSSHSRKQALTLSRPVHLYAACSLPSRQARDLSRTRTRLTKTRCGALVDAREGVMSTATSSPVRSPQEAPVAPGCPARPGGGSGLGSPAEIREQTVTSCICCPAPPSGHRQTDRAPFFNQNMTARSRRERRSASGSS
jgi:hypothetical protein